jgi:hypothetical protein
VSRNYIKAYIIIFSCIFVFLLFITWQQIVIFRLGYRITALKQDIVEEEIIRQQIMRELYLKTSLSSIDKKAVGQFSMKIPGNSECLVLRVDSSELFLSDDDKKTELLAVIKDIFSPAAAEAR